MIKPQEINNIQEHMKHLEEIKKENPFKVPDGYFDSLTERMMKAVKESEETSVYDESRAVRKIHFRPFLALAAAIIGFAVITTIMVRLLSEKDKSFFGNSENELYADLVSEEIDTYMLENEFSGDEGSETSESSVSTEAIINYLVLEDVELTDIYELYN